MRIGIVWPQTELGGDPGAVRAFGEAVEELGFAHVLAYDHVLGADPAVHTGWTAGYDVHTTFREPLVMFGYLAAITSAELVTGVLILPQRQTALVAKQVAELDVLTGGHVRLGVGLGWNAVEYEALGRSFHDRAVRISEQIAVLRRLWTEPSVTHRGGSETIVGAGLAPMPLQRPIPIWIGALSERAFPRIGRLADGWFPMMRPGPDLDRALAIVADAAVDAGRDPASIGMEGRTQWRMSDPDRSARQVDAWRRAGASHVTVNTMNEGYATIDEHIACMTEVAEALELLPGDDRRTSRESSAGPVER
jgi:probable F420-dependent oxidoreductase